MTQPRTPSPYQRRYRPALLAAAALVIAAGGIVWALAVRPAPEPRRSGPALAVAVVAPTEPDIDPGSAMEVGELSDGFDRAALDRRAAGPDDRLLPPDAYAGRDWGLDTVPRMPMPTPVAEAVTPMQAYRGVVERMRNIDALDDGSRLFGFDRPLPDFAAERAARWAARDDGTDPMPVPAPADSGPGPVAYTDVVKYSSE